MSGKPCETIDEFRDLVRDKRVVYVGNGMNAIRQQKGAWIDDHDIVIRSGRAIQFLDDERYAPYLGTKVDVWVTGALRQSMRRFLGDDVTTLMSKSTRTRVDPGNPDYPHVLMHELDELYSLENHYIEGNEIKQKRLSTGACVAHFMNHKANTFKELNFCNIDFFTKAIPMDVSLSKKNGKENHKIATWSWHLSIPIPGKLNHDGSSAMIQNHPAHDSQAERRIVMEAVDNNDNIHFIGNDSPKFSYLAYSADLPWDGARKPLDSKSFEQHLINNKEELRRKYRKSK